MIEIRKLMEFVYDELSKFAPVHFEDMDREVDGSISLIGTNIVYSLEGVYQLTDNEVRKDIPLIIDIWYLKEDVYGVEDMVYEIDKRLHGFIFREDNTTFKIERDNNFSINVPDDSPNIRRKRLNYVVKFYKY